MHAIFTSLGHSITHNLTLYNIYGFKTWCHGMKAKPEEIFRWKRICTPACALNVGCIFVDENDKCNRKYQSKILSIKISKDSKAAQRVLRKYCSCHGTFICFGFVVERLLNVTIRQNFIEIFFRRWRVFGSDPVNLNPKALILRQGNNKSDPFLHDTAWAWFDVPA